MQCRNITQLINQYTLPEMQHYEIRLGNETTRTCTQQRMKNKYTKTMLEQAYKNIIFVDESINCRAQ